MIGVLSTAVATLNWSSFLLAIIVISVFSLVTALVFWIIVIKKKIYSDQL